MKRTRKLKSLAFVLTCALVLCATVIVVAAVEPDEDELSRTNEEIEILDYDEGTVASVNGQEYSALTDAFSAAGDTDIMYHDTVSETDTSLTVDQSAAIDMNGYNRYVTATGNNSYDSVVTYTAEIDSICVEVITQKGDLPDDAELIVVRYEEDSEEYSDAAEEIGYNLERANMIALDICFVVDGKEVEPKNAVQVSIDVSAALPDDTDLNTIEVTHLEEKSFLFGLFHWEKPVTVIGEDEGSKEDGILTFSVKNFSVFTVTWDDDTGTTIEVHVYSVNGTSIDEKLDVESYTSTNSVITISDLVSHLGQNATYTNTYTYRYATVVYETQMGQGYSSTSYGSENNSVVSLSKSGTTYTVTTSSGTTTVSDPADIVIHLYYSIPTVTLGTEDPYGETVEFTTSSSYFVGDTSSATYTWALSDDTLGTLVHPTSGQATFTWSDSAQSGDQVTVTVTMTVGEETASDTYTLTYGDDPITFTVYAQDGTTPQANARVALVDASGNTVATGATGSDGTVTLYAPAGEYTVGVTYVYLVSDAGGGSTSRATAETTITVSDDETATGSVTLGTAVTSGPGGNTSGSYGGGSEPYYYEHIDVKVAVAETSDSDVSFSDLDAVYVYDKYGNLLYVSEDINANPGTTDYNVLFDINANEDQHSIVVSSEDTIVLVYEVKDNETGVFSTYTVSYSSGESYPDDEYYPATAVNAYQLYNILYNANYASQEAFEAAWGPGFTGYNEAGISISGYSYTLIADYLCDTRATSGQAGLDFVIYVQELDAIQDNVGFRIAKTVANVPETFGSDDIENFTFTLQELDKVQDNSEWTEAIWSTEEGNVLSTNTGTISSFTTNGDGTWSGVIDFSGVLEYEAVDGTNFYYYILSEQTPTTTTPTQQYFGLKVTVTYNAATGDETIVVSYCTLGTQDDYPYYRTSGWTELTAYTDTSDEGEEYTYYSIPFVNTYSTTGFELEKVDNSGNALDGAVFTMTTTEIEGDGTNLYFTSETTTDEETQTEHTVYQLASEDTQGASTEITVTGGSVSIQGIAAGTYTLTEIKAPEGYATIESFTVTIDADGKVTVSENSNVSVTGPSESEEPDEDETESVYIITVIDIEVTEITVEKKWADNNDAYETRPESITVTVTGSDGSTYTLTLSEENDWSDTLSELPKFDSTGAEITYSVTEAEIENYDGDVVDNGDGTYTITNTLTGETEISVEKEWIDNNNAYETRPESITVAITGSDESTYTLTLSEENDWSDTLSELPKYDSTGTEITYTVTEAEIENYEGEVVDNENGTYTITNTLLIDISGSKVWVNDTESERPDSITIHLYADNEEVTDSNGNPVTVTATSENDWKWSFTNLPKYNSDGEEIVYTVLEGEISGSRYLPTYDTDADGNIIITNAIPEVHKDVSDPAYGESTDDNLHQDEADNNDTLEYKMEADHIGGAHDLVLHDFLSDQLDMTTLKIQSVTLYTGEKDDNGTVLTEGTDYTVTTDECSADCGLDGCSFEIHIIDADVENLSADAYVIVIFDILVREGVDDFDDNYVDEIDNFVGLSFMAFNVSTYAEPDETETYSYGFDLYKYDSETGEPLAGVEFILSKDTDDGTVYAQFEVTGSTYLLTGWVDGKDDATAIVTGSDGNAVVEGLHDGTFKIEETKTPDGYQQLTGTMTVTITVDEDDPLNPTITATNATVTGGIVSIANTPTPESEAGNEPITIIGSKTWNDSNDADGIRPDSITIHLFQDGIEIDTITVTEADGWAWSFEGLDGSYTYTISEDIVYGYTTEIDGYNVTNTHIPDIPETPDEPDTDTPDEPEPDLPDEPELPDEPNPDNPDEPELEEPEIPDESQEPESPQEPDESETPELPEEQVTPNTPDEPDISEPGSDLPQTGYRWNLVMCMVILAIGGVLLIGTGRAIMSTEKRKKR